MSARQMAMTNLRAVVGDMTLDDVLSKRDQINATLQRKLDEVTERWGVKVTAVEIREIEPPPVISDAMTRQMSAERTRRPRSRSPKGSATRRSTWRTARGRPRSCAAEGDKQSTILRAEGRREAQLLDAEGFASALQRIFETAQGVDANTMGLQYLDTLRTIGQSPSTKWIIPTELMAVANTISTRIGQTAGATATAKRTAARAAPGSAGCAPGPLRSRVRHTRSAGVRRRRLFVHRLARHRRLSATTTPSGGNPNHDHGDHWQARAERCHAVASAERRHHALHVPSRQSPARAAA